MAFCSTTLIELPASHFGAIGTASVGPVTARPRASWPYWCRLVRAPAAPQQDTRPAPAGSGRPEPAAGYRDGARWWWREAAAPLPWPVQGPGRRAGADGDRGR